MSTEVIENKIIELIKKRARIHQVKILLLCICIALPSSLVLMTLDYYFIFGEVVRSSNFAGICLLSLLIAFIVYLKQIKPYTERQALKELEEHPDNNSGQLLRTAMEYKDKDPAIFKELIYNARQELHTLELPKIQNYSLLKKLFIYSAIVLISMLLILSLVPQSSTALERFIIPAKTNSYTKIEFTEKPIQFEKGEFVHIKAKLSGRSVEQAFIKVQNSKQEKWQSFEIQPQDNELIISLPSQKSDFTFYIEAGDGQTLPHKVQMVVPVKIKSFTAKVTPPNYTSLKKKTVNTSHFSVLEGSTVKWTFESSELAEKATLQLAKKSFPVTINNSLISTELTLSEPGHYKYFLTGQGKNGLGIKKKEFSVEVIKDKAPSIKITKPNTGFKTRSDDEFDVAYKATDDYGVKESGLVFIFDKTKDTLIEKIYEAKDKIDVSESIKLYLEKYPINIKSNISLLAYVIDSKGQKRFSETLFIDVQQYKIYTHRPKDEDPSGGMPGGSPDALMTLNEIIDLQRKNLSVFNRFTEREFDNKSEKKILDGQQTVIKELVQAKSNPEMAGTILPEEHAIIDLAVSHAKKSNELISSNKDLSHSSSSECLTELMRLKKQLEKRMKNPDQSQPSESSKGGDQPFSPDQFLERLKDLQAETQDFSERLVKVIPTRPSPLLPHKAKETLTRLHDEAGEIDEMLIAHPYKTATLRNRMDKAVEELHAALESENSKDAMIELQKANYSLFELIEILKNLDAKKLPQAIQQMALSARDLANQIDNKQWTLQSLSQDQSSSLFLNDLLETYFTSDATKGVKVRHSLNEIYNLHQVNEYNDEAQLWRSLAESQQDQKVKERREIQQAKVHKLAEDLEKLRMKLLESKLEQLSRLKDKLEDIQKSGSTGSDPKQDSEKLKDKLSQMDLQKLLNKGQKLQEDMQGDQDDELEKGQEDAVRDSVRGLSKEISKALDSKNLSLEQKEAVLKALKEAGLQEALAPSSGQQTTGKAMKELNKDGVFAAKESLAQFNSSIDKMIDKLHEGSQKRPDPNGNEEMDAQKKDPQGQNKEMNAQKEDEQKNQDSHQASSSTEECENPGGNQGSKGQGSSEQNSSAKEQSTIKGQAKNVKSAAVGLIKDAQASTKGQVSQQNIENKGQHSQSSQSSALADSHYTKLHEHIHIFDHLDIVEEIQGLQDAKLSDLSERYANELKLSGEPSDETLQNIQKRLKIIIDKLVDSNYQSEEEIHIPLKYKRFVEKYFQRLSDDLGE